MKVCLEIVRHEYVAGACDVVPGNGKSTEEGTDPVDGDGVQFLEGLDEVVGVLLVDIVYPKVVNNEIESDELGGGVCVCYRSPDQEGMPKL